MAKNETKSTDTTNTDTNETGETPVEVFYTLLGSPNDESVQSLVAFVADSSERTIAVPMVSTTGDDRPDVVRLRGSDAPTFVAWKGDGQKPRTYVYQHRILDAETAQVLAPFLTLANGHISGVFCDVENPRYVREVELDVTRRDFLAGISMVREIMQAPVTVGVVAQWWTRAAKGNRVVLPSGGKAGEALNGFLTEHGLSRQDLETALTA